MVEMPSQQDLTARLTNLIIRINKVKIGTQPSSKGQDSLQNVHPLDGFLGQSHVYKLQEVRRHCDRKDCWIVLWDRVYDVTPFLREHPGGEDIIMENAGRDATIPFNEVGHSTEAMALMNKYCIGLIAEEDRIGSKKCRKIAR